MTRKDLKTAQNKLAEAGWVHIFSVMHDGEDSGEYGLCYQKQDGEAFRHFYLNKDTYQNLPN